jgi:hypothetical protein
MTRPGPSLSSRGRSRFRAIGRHGTGSGTRFRRLPSVGPDGILKCPRQIAIVSTGLIFHLTQERQLLMSKSFGMLIVDEAHRARGKKVRGQDDRDPNNLLAFLNEAAKRTKHVLLGTATPIQTDIVEGVRDRVRAYPERYRHARQPVHLRAAL